MTISLPDEIADDVRRRARKRRSSVSGVIADALRKNAEEEIRERMREGYRAMADEDRRLAEEALPAIREILPDD